MKVFRKMTLAAPGTNYSLAWDADDTNGHSDADDGAYEDES